MGHLDPIIERFRYSHHTVAMHFAAGLSIKEIAKRTGFTTRRLVILLDDPTFQELIEHYRKPHIEAMHTAIGEAQELMAFAHSASLRQINDRLEDADEGGDPIPLQHLIKIHGEMADRIGYSKHTVKDINHNISFANALDRAIERSGKAPELKLIEGQVLPTVALRPREYRRT